MADLLGLQVGQLEDLVVLPSSFLTMTRSRMRMMPLSWRATSSGAISPFGCQGT
jgi:hypothetical protein